MVSGLNAQLAQPVLHSFRHPCGGALRRERISFRSNESIVAAFILMGLLFAPFTLASAQTSDAKGAMRRVLIHRRLSADAIGVPVRFAFDPTVALALQLRPATRRIIVIAGNAEPDRRHLALTRTALARYTEKFAVQYLVGLPLSDTLAAVSALPSDAVVLYVTMFRDADGPPHVPRDVLTQIAAVSPVPVFGVFETYLGHGIAAGSITTYAEQGRRTGELVARVLNGEPLSQIGVQTAGFSRCIADWRQLRRWGLDARLLPEDCEIRFKPVTVWDRYHWQILGVSAVFLAQAASILVLMLNRRRLRQAQAALLAENARRAKAEALAAQLRSRLARFSKQRSLGAMATTIAHEINQPLIAIQNYAQAVKRRLQLPRRIKPSPLLFRCNLSGSHRFRPFPRNHPPG